MIPGAEGSKVYEKTNKITEENYEVHKGICNLNYVVAVGNSCFGSTY
jgi:hypothetical protein